MTRRQAFGLLFACFLLPLGTFGQGFVLSNDIPVISQGQTLASPWAGGLNSPQASPIDLNRDGLDDLFVFDAQDQTIGTYLNEGVVGQSRYTFAPEYISSFPSDLSNWVLLKDFNGDGHPDIFTAPGFASNIRVFINTTPTNGGQLSFAPFKDTLSTDYPPLRYLYSARTDIPAIEDMDGDGDLDILTFDVGGAVLGYHRNTSMELNGDLSALDFVQESGCFGHFKEASSGCSPELNQPPCAPGQRPGSGPRHAGSTLLALDLNGDSRKDLIVGDVGCDHVYALYQSDTSQTAHFDSTQLFFPTNSTPIRIENFIGTFYLDVDNDGIKDLLASPTQTGNIDNFDGFWRYHNQGSASLPDFQLAEQGFLQNDMIETGSGTNPAFLDYDQDGRTDLLLGSLGKYTVGAGFAPVLQLFRNTGSAQAPEFTLVDDNYLDLAGTAATSAMEYPAPALGDLDGDGDEDLLIGEFSGDLFYFENTASTGSVANFVLNSSNYFGINTDLYSSPALGDLDADGDLDLLIGNIRGDIHFYENTGTATATNFVFVTDTFGGIEITDFTGQPFSNGFAKPMVKDYDGDGDLEILVGGKEGGVEVFENVTTAPGAVFPSAGDLGNLDFGAYSSPAGAVLDSTGHMTFVLGGIRGGLQLFQPLGVVSSPEILEPQAQLLLYPNPARDILHLELEASQKALPIRRTVYNAMGKLLKADMMRSSKSVLDVASWPAGVYFLRLEGNGIETTKKFTVQR